MLTGSAERKIQHSFCCFFKETIDTENMTGLVLLYYATFEKVSTCHLTFLTAYILSQINDISNVTFTNV